jgi:chromosome segregation ATPase
MLKKILVISGLVVVVAWACGNNVCKEIGSYVRTGWKEIRSATKQNISIDFEIRRGEDLLATLHQTDDRLLDTLGTELQAMRSGEREIEIAQANLEIKKVELQALNEKVKNWQTSGGDSSIRREQMKVELERKFQFYKSAERALKAKMEAQKRHQERVEMIKEQREALKQQRADLAARLEKLKTDLEVLKLAEARTKHGVPEEQLEELNQLKTLVDGLEARVEKQMIILELKRDQEPKSAPSGSKAGTQANQSVTNDVDAYFGNTKEEPKPTVKK